MHACSLSQTDARAVSYHDSRSGRSGAREVSSRRWGRCPLCAEALDARASMPVSLDARARARACSYARMPHEGHRLSRCRMLSPARLVGTSQLGHHILGVLNTPPMLMAWLRVPDAPHAPQPCGQHRLGMGGTEAGSPWLLASLMRRPCSGSCMLGCLASKESKQQSRGCRACTSPHHAPKTKTKHDARALA